MILFIITDSCKLSTLVFIPKKLLKSKHLDKYIDRKGLEGNGPNVSKWDLPNMPTWSAWTWWAE